MKGNLRSLSIILSEYLNALDFFGKTHLADGLNHHLTPISTLQMEMNISMFLSLTYFDHQRVSPSAFSTF